MAFSVFIYRYEPFKSGFEITDQLGGNIFPATILSTATTDANLIVPADSDYIGNPKSCIAIRLKNSYANSKLRIEVAETPFFSQSVSEFILPKAGKEYLVFRILYGTIRLCVIIIRQCPLASPSRRN